MQTNINNGALNEDVTFDNTRGSHSYFEQTTPVYVHGSQQESGLRIHQIKYEAIQRPTSAATESRRPSKQHGQNVGNRK